jgi:hypothetical protein
MPRHRSNFSNIRVWGAAWGTASANNAHTDEGFDWELADSRYPCLRGWSRVR